MLADKHIQEMSMPFQKGNKLGAKKFYQRELGEKITLQLYKGQKEKLKTVPDWQNKIRDYVEQLITDGG